MRIEEALKIADRLIKILINWHFKDCGKEIKVEVKDD